MKALDRLLQRWRMGRALRHVANGARVLDIGTFDGRLFELGRTRNITGVGIDPGLVVAPVDHGSYRLVRGSFPGDVHTEQPFDVVTALAVLEHVPVHEMPSLLRAIHDRMLPHGRFIVSVPSPLVDRILPVLLALRLVDGQSLEQHYGLETKVLQDLIARAGFRLVAHERFQLGLNNLLVYER